jgi:hypothetical protein
MALIESWSWEQFAGKQTIRYKEENGMSEMVETMYARDFNIIPNTGKDFAPAMVNLFAVIGQKNHPVKLVFEVGQYDIYRENACKKELFVTNSMGFDECGEHPVHAIAMPLEGIKDLTISGKGAEIIVHDNMTYMLINQCEHIEIEDLTFDFETPSMTEMEASVIGLRSVTYRNALFKTMSLIKCT